MRILFLTHRVPHPPDKGDRIRSYNIIKLLAKSHSVFLMAVSHESIHPDAHEVLGTFCAAVDLFRINPFLRKLQSVLYLMTRKPLTLPFFHSKRLRRALARRLQDTPIDLIYIYSSPMAQYVLAVDRIPKLMDFIDVDSQKWLDYAATSRPPMKMVYRREGTRLRTFEKQVASLCDLNVFAAEREAALFRQIAPASLVKVVQNGVDIKGNGASLYRKNRIVFVGAMDYFPNIDAMLFFTNEILPLVKRSISDVELFIIGGNPAKQIRDLGRFNNVVVTGYVDDITPYLRDAAASVAPLRIARGTQQKILESMAHGVPVITTSAALGGIEADPGINVLVADEPSGFAEKIMAILKDRNFRRTLAENALALVRKEYSWESRLTVLEDSITSVCRKE